MVTLKDEAKHWVYEESALRNLVTSLYSSLFTTFGS